MSLGAFGAAAHGRKSDVEPMKNGRYRSARGIEFRC